MIVEDYKNSWVSFIGLEGTDKRLLISEIEERVTSILVPTYEKTFSTKDLLQFTAEMFEYALEMAVCAYVAYKYSEVELAWASLSKASELMGLCVGTRTLLNKNKSYRKTRKGTFRRVEGEEFLKECMIKKLGEKLEELNEYPEEMQIQIMHDLSEPEVIREFVLDKLTDYAYSIRASLGLGFSVPSKKDKELNSDEIERGEESFTKFKLKARLEYWIKKDGALKDAFDELFSRYSYLSGSNPVTINEQEGVDTVQISVRHLNDIYGMISDNHEIMHEFLDVPNCESEECPVRKRYQNHNRKIERLLKDPLFDKI